MFSSLANCALPTAVALGLVRRAMSSSSSSSSSSIQIKTLHVYDHCPFCIRVDLVLGWNDILYSRKLYGYADIDGPTALTGKKQLPVLEYVQDGETKYLPESLDIIEFLVEKGFAARPPMAQSTQRQQSLKTWEKQHKPSVNDLTRSRILKLPKEYVDFATQADRDYAMNKYIKKGFSYTNAQARTEEALAECAASLQAFEQEFLPNGEISLHGGTEYGMDDIVYLPDLRKLTCVKDLQIPAGVRKYVETAMNKGGVSLYNDWAC
jgi:glutaredoxin 2